MDIDKVEQIASIGTFEEIIAAAYLVSDKAQEKKMQCMFLDTWKKYRNQLREQSIKKGKLQWATKRN